MKVKATLTRFPVCPHCVSRFENGKLIEKRMNHKVLCSFPVFRVYKNYLEAEFFLGQCSLCGKLFACACVLPPVPANGIRKIRIKRRHPHEGLCEDFTSTSYKPVRCLDCVLMARKSPHSFGLLLGRGQEVSNAECPFCGSRRLALLTGPSKPLPPRRKILPAL
jgi:ribosomal protein L37AE/L43A